MVLEMLLMGGIDKRASNYESKFPFFGLNGVAPSSSPLSLIFKICSLLLSRFVLLSSQLSLWLILPLTLALSPQLASYKSRNLIGAWSRQQVWC
jgi:hypothetical protein